MPITGKELLAKVKALTGEGLTKPQQAKACGYLRVVASGESAGKEVPDVNAFQGALLEATGVSFPEADRFGAPRGQLTVTRAETIVIGKAYLSKVEAQPGDRYAVEIQDDGVICLVPVTDEEPAGKQVEMAAAA